MNIENYAIGQNMGSELAISQAMKAAYKSMNEAGLIGTGQQIQHYPQIIIDPDFDFLQQLQEWPSYEAETHDCSECNHTFAAFDLPEIGKISGVAYVDGKKVCLHCLYSKEPETAGFNGYYAPLSSIEMKDIKANQVLFLHYATATANQAYGNPKNPKMEDTPEALYHAVKKGFSSIWGDSMPNNANGLHTLAEGGYITPDYRKSEKVKQMQELYGFSNHFNFFSNQREFADRLKKQYCGQKGFILSPSITYAINKYTIACKPSV